MFKEMKCTNGTATGEPIYDSINDLSGQQHEISQCAKSYVDPQSAGDIPLVELQLKSEGNTYESIGCEGINRSTLDSEVSITETRFDSVANCDSPQENEYLKEYLSFAPSPNDKIDQANSTYDLVSQGPIVVPMKAKVDEIILTGCSPVLPPSASDEYLDVRSDTTGCSQTDPKDGAADVGTAYTNVTLLAAPASTAPTDNEYVEVKRPG